MDDIPEWAVHELCRRAGIDHVAIFGDRTNRFIAARLAIREGAKLIAEHEEEPVDPLLVEAREIYVAQPGFAQSPDSADNILNGRYTEDSHTAQTMGLLTTALKRGIEIGKSDA